MKLLKIMFVVFIVSNIAPSFAAEWVPIMDNTLYYDKSNVNFDTITRNYSVWVKGFLSDSTLKELQNEFLKGISKRDYSHYSHNIIHFEVKCRNETSLLLSVDEFNDNDKVIYSWYYNYDDKKEYPSLVIPLNYRVALAKEVCKSLTDQIKTKKKSP